jgi:AcrR family transcriptional regulator
MTKIEIIHAAFKVWGRNYYRKTSLSQLAGELGVSKPALYRHFASKQALTTAMIEQFLCDFSASIRDDFKKALQEKDADEGISIIIHSICGYFARNVYALIFSLINIYDRKLEKYTLTESLKSRGADMGTLQIVMEKKYDYSPVMIRLIFATLTFLMTHFQKEKDAMTNPLSLDDINYINTLIYKTIKNGLMFSIEKTAVDFKMLEKLVDEMPLNTQSEPFFKAVAEAVAEAGPWDVSMEMVAKRIGLSKSSLYGHFKNKKDMLRRLFITEFTRIIGFARQSIKLSDDAAQKLYLGIYSITVYLRSRPEILISMDWIRTRKLDLGKPEKKTEIFRLFEDVDIESLQNANEDEKHRTCHWILFLLINILSNPIAHESMEALQEEEALQKEKSPNNKIRMLYKFITLGIGGFIR